MHKLIDPYFRALGLLIALAMVTMVFMVFGPSSLIVHKDKMTDDSEGHTPPQTTSAGDAALALFLRPVCLQGASDCVWKVLPT